MSSFIFGMPRSNPFSQWSHVTMTHAIRSKQTNVSWQLKQNKYKISSCYKISSAAYHPTGTLEKTICVLFHTFHWSPVHIQCQFKAMNLRFDIFTCLIPALLTNSCPVYDPARPLCSTGTTQHWLQLTAWKFWDIVQTHMWWLKFALLLSFFVINKKNVLLIFIPFVCTKYRDFNHYFYSETILLIVRFSAQHSSSESILGWSSKHCQELIQAYLCKASVGLALTHDHTVFTGFHMRFQEWPRVDAQTWMIFCFTWS